jgi:prephenate dehydratase
MKIGYQGYVGSNCEKIANMYNEEFCNGKSEVIPLITSENVVSALEDGSITEGVLAERNSIAGIVYETANALKTKDYKIIKEYELPISHSVYMRPNADKRKIKRVFGHIQALNQCKVYLKNNFYDIELKVINDGAKVAEELCSDKYTDRDAVVCPKGTGELYGLELIKDNIEDKEDNKTKFIVIKIK